MKIGECFPFITAGKDIAKLADILGHSSIETTRVYIITTGNELERRTIVVGEMPKEPAAADETPDEPGNPSNEPSAEDETKKQTPDEPENADTKSSAPIVIAVVAVVAAVAAAVVILAKKQKTKTR